VSSVAAQADQFAGDIGNTPPFLARNLREGLALALFNQNLSTIQSSVHRWFPFV